MKHCFLTGQMARLQLLVQAAIDSARGARSAPLTGDDCLHVLEVIFGAYRASETGMSQTIPEHKTHSNPPSSP